jgi:23S rRNA (adenine2503-C2)-methyltransferase
VGLNRLLDYTLIKLKKDLELNGFQGYRAKQIFEQVSKGQFDFTQMKILPEPLRHYLRDRFTAMSLTIEKVFKSSVDETHKYLFKLEDGAIIEAVFMAYDHGNSVCITTQVGCKMGCTFCASYIGGFKRNLSSGELLEQILAIQSHQGKRISHVVLMGSGEPLDNYEQVLSFFKQIASKEILDLSLRHITVSTCGLVPKIKALAQEGLPITLAVSLHAPNDTMRTEIMPINKTYPIAEVLEAAEAYAEITGRRVTFEYALIENFNDGLEQAKELASKLKGLLCHVNLIPINPVVENQYVPPNTKRIHGFAKVLEERRIPVSIRRELGSDINAACGQLRNQYMEMKGL